MFLGTGVKGNNVLSRLVAVQTRLTQWIVVLGSYVIVWYYCGKGGVLSASDNDLSEPICTPCAADRTHTDKSY